MKPMIFYIALLLLTVSALFGRIPMVLSWQSEQAIEENAFFMKSIKVMKYHSEEEVLHAYLEGRAKLGILRTDMLAKLMQNPRVKGHLSYSILGKLSHQSILYFRKKSGISFSHTQEPLSGSISIGLLGDHANQYFKKMFESKHLPYGLHPISLDAYHSLGLLKKDKIQAMFLFVSPDYFEKYQQYASPYPSALAKVLEAEEALSCTETYCYASYYLIASDVLGDKVMHQINTQMEKLFDKDLGLKEHLGKYFIDTTFKKPETLLVHKQKVIEKEKEAPLKSFGRAPWMDIAITEAMKGKGSSEATWPMLGLSYKYIRFAKGKSGLLTAPNDSVEGSWCAAYVCWTLNHSGYSIHPKGRMASQSFRYFNNQLYKKIKNPIFGAIILYTNIKNPAHGHVGYLFGKTASGKYIVLGGNQSNRLKFSSYPSYFAGNKLKGFYVPISYQIHPRDRLTKKDIYRSANALNRKYGIKENGNGYGVR